MISHYNAFISYKHADVDSKVAERVQKDLENFHIPHSLGKKLGIKRIDRIFRDKTELPTTSDLSEEITYALNNSDFLIVICSPRVKQSIWVQREIELFLRAHSKKNVLTVIAEGDPTEVIPEILLHDEVTIQQPNGVYSTAYITTEPLSCDYRNMRKAKKDELPRLASCIIGCSYDELMRRRRKHEIHRVIAIASIVAVALLSFGLYMMYSKTIINQNYNNALINRSRYLATESEKFLDEEDRIQALFLALAALPKDEESDIPVTPEAERALVDASLAYQTLAGSQLNAYRNYRLPGQIKDFELSPNGRYLVAFDEYSNLGLWDALTSASIQVDISDISNINAVKFIDDDSLLLLSYDGLHCYETETGKLLWKNDDNNVSYSTKISITNDTAYFLSESTVTLVNTKDGSIEKTIEFPESEDDLTATNMEMSVSPSGQYIAIEQTHGLLESGMRIYDTKTESFYTPYQREDEPHVMCFKWTEDNNLCVAYGKDAENQRQLDISILSVDNAKVKCIDPQAKKVLWENDFYYTDVAVKKDFLELPQTDSILFYASNKAEIYDRKTGKILYNHNINSNIICASDSNGDGMPIYVTENGEVVFPTKDSEDTIYVRNDMTDKIDKAYYKNNIYVHRKMTQDIICYAYGLYDPDWHEMENSPTFEDSLSYYILDENVLALITKDSDTVCISVYDVNSGTFLMKEPLSDDPNRWTYSYKLMGSYKNKLYYIADDDDSLCLYSIDLQTKNISLATNIDTTEIFLDKFTFLDGKLYYTTKVDNGYEFRIYDTENDKTDSVNMDIDYYYSYRSPIISDDRKFAYLSSSEGRDDYIIDIQNKTVTPVVKPEGYKETQIAAYDSLNNIIAITDGNLIITLDYNGIELNRQGNMGISALSLYVWTENKKSLLLVPYDNGTLSFYDITNFTETDSMEISLYINATNNIKSFQLDRDKNILYMSSDTLTDMIDLNNKYETACVQNCFGHHMATDRFYNFFYEVSKEKHIGYFNHYNISDLIEKGTEMLGSSEMSESDKLKYGIEDD